MARHFGASQARRSGRSKPAGVRLAGEVTDLNGTGLALLERLTPACPSATEQQLARLRASGIVAASRRGAATRYSVTDPQLKDLLATAKLILNRRLVGVRSLLRELNRDAPGRARSLPPA